MSAAGSLIVLLDGSTIGSRIFRAPLLRYIGTISYGIYLLHSFVFSAFLRTRLVTRVIDNGSLLHAAFVLVLEYVAVIGIASASFFLFESPFLRLKRFFPAEAKGTGEGNALTWSTQAARAPVGIPNASQVLPARIAYCEVSLPDRQES
jgi:peptidoglycan/LPS O-acetylase OafA/YrhL